ncbi:unnamed protein product, partial [Laminaria digitata]
RSWAETPGNGEGSAGGRRRSGRGRSRRRSKPSSNSMLESCQALRSKVEHQRKRRGELHLPGGGRVPYNNDAPDLRMDLAGIAGSLSDDEMRHVGCPYYRSMSAPEYAELAHRVTRPTVGLADGGDGIYDIEDLRSFGRDPRGFAERKKTEQKPAAESCS